MISPPVPLADIKHILEYSEPLWRELKGQHLFITGGTGFFGTWLLEALRAANEHFDSRVSVTVLSRDPAAFAAKEPRLASQPRLIFQRGDVRGLTVSLTHYDHVIHAATESSSALNERQPELMLDTIISGTRKVLEFAAAGGIKSLLLISSGAVYGRQPGGLSKIPESFTGGPDVNSPYSAYGESKRMAELLCAVAAKLHDINAKIARCFAFVGPHLPLDAHFAAGNFLRDALAGGPIVINGDGRPSRSYMHPADLMVWLLTILVRGQSNRPYNVGSDQSISIAELASRIASLVPGEPLIDIRSQPTGRPAHRYVPATDRARHELGLEIRIDLDQSLRRTVDWLREARK